MPILGSLTQADLGQVNEELATKLPACIDVQDVVKSYKSLRELYYPVLVALCRWSLLEMHPFL